MTSEKSDKNPPVTAADLSRILAKGYDWEARKKGVADAVRWYLVNVLSDGSAVSTRDLACGIVNALSGDEDTQRLLLKHLGIEAKGSLSGYCSKTGPEVRIYGKTVRTYLWSSAAQKSVDGDYKVCRCCGQRIS